MQQENVKQWGKAGFIGGKIINLEIDEKHFMVLLDEFMKDITDK